MEQQVWNAILDKLKDKSFTVAMARTAAPGAKKMEKLLNKLVRARRLDIDSTGRFIVINTCRQLRMRGRPLGPRSIDVQLDIEERETCMLLADARERFVALDVAAPVVVHSSTIDFVRSVNDSHERFREIEQKLSRVEELEMRLAHIAALRAGQVTSETPARCIHALLGSRHERLLVAKRKYSEVV